MNRSSTMKHAKNLARIARNSLSSVATEVRSKIAEKKAQIGRASCRERV